MEKAQDDMLIAAGLASENELLGAIARPQIRLKRTSNAKSNIRARSRLDQRGIDSN
jgi:hypothetical protein